MRATIVVFSIFLNRLDGVFYIHQYSSLQRLEFGSSNSTAWTTFDTWLFHQSDLHWRICLKVGSRVKQLCTFKTNVDPLMFSYNFSIITIMNAGKFSICSHHLSILLTLFKFFSSQIPFSYNDAYPQQREKKFMKNLLLDGQFFSFHSGISSP